MMNTRSGTSQMDISGLSSATTDMTLPKDTPEWGVQLFHLLQNSITATSNETSQRIEYLTITTNSINQRITDLCNEVKTSVDAANAKADRALQLIETYADQNAKLSSEVAYLSDALKFVLSEQQRHETHILKNESYSRRENLVFRGFPPNDREPCDGYGVCCQQWVLKEKMPYPFPGVTTSRITGKSLFALNVLRTELMCGVRDLL